MTNKMEQIAKMFGKEMVKNPQGESQKQKES
jgi:hypothetical protein